jgi:hypothetical protein
VVVVLVVLDGVVGVVAVPLSSGAAWPPLSCGGEEAEPPGTVVAVVVLPSAPGAVEVEVVDGTGVVPDGTAVVGSVAVVPSSVLPAVVGGRHRGRDGVVAGVLGVAAAAGDQAAARAEREHREEARHAGLGDGGSQRHSFYG